MFSVIYSHHIMHESLGGAQIRRLHTEPYKFEWNISANNSRMEHRTNLRLGEIVCYSWSSIIFEIRSFYSKKVSDLFFDCVTVKTGNFHWCRAPLLSQDDSGMNK